MTVACDIVTLCDGLWHHTNSESKIERINGKENKNKKRNKDK